MRKQYPLASSLFFDIPLALLPSKRDEVLSFWEAKLAGVHIDLTPYQKHADTAEGEDTSAASDIQYAPTRGGQIAILPLYGVISQRMNMLSEMSGGTSTEAFGSMLRDAVNNPEIKAIIIDVDSPGGSTYGLTELGDIMYALRGQKPIIAVANSVMASGAYWLASQADEIVSTPGGEVGHIGVASLHLDKSQALSAGGIKPYLITAGKYKAEQTMGSDLVEPTLAGLEHMQEQVDEAYGRFVSTVARGRGVTADEVINGMGEGRVLPASLALKAGLIDRIGTLEQTIQRVSNGGGQRKMRVNMSVAMLHGGNEIPDYNVGLADPADEALSHNEFAEAILYADTGIQDEATPWSRPTLADFTDKPWSDLSDSEKMRIARHASWSGNVPPESFSDIGGFHHQPSKMGVGPANWRAVSSGRMENASWSNDLGVRAHRAAHYKQFSKPIPWEADSEGGNEEKEKEAEFDANRDRFRVQRWKHQQALDAVAHLRR